MRLKKILFMFLLIPALLVDWSTLSHSNVVFEDIVTMTVDGFEVPDEWVIKFSKYRSKNWDNDLKKDYEESKKWMKWVGTSKDKNKREEILPDGVAKNVYLKSKENTILAIRGRWDFPGKNWLVLEPNNIRPSKEYLKNWLRLVADEKTFKPKRQEWADGVNPNFIWLPGKVKSMALYVWGGNFDYDMECYVQDYKGNEYVLPIGNLKYKGWKKQEITVPSNIEQYRGQVPNTQPLKFIRFKLTANPYENPNEFYAYLDYFHAVTDIYEPNYYGEELQFVENYWGEGSTSTASPTKDDK